MSNPDLREALDALIADSEGELRASAWAALTLHVVLASGCELSDRPAAERRLLELLWVVPAPLDEIERKVRVLLVEDNELVVRSVRRLLGPNYDIVWAVDGVAARELLLAPGGLFDVILSDVQMPRLDGFGLLRWIRTQRPYLLNSLVFMTADPEHSTARLIAMTHLVLKKPCTRAMLQQVVTAAQNKGQD